MKPNSEHITGVAFDKLFNFSKSRFLHLQDRVNNTSFWMAARNK